jgi:hypothetical protein
MPDIRHPIDDPAHELQVMPHAWQSRKGVRQHAGDLVAGVSSIMDRAQGLFQSMFHTKYKGLADMMSGSVSKWVVCPLKSATDFEELDTQLGVEDSAFKDFQKEAYSKWTGYQAKVPGDECEKPTFLGDEFRDSSVCNITELHANHVEKYIHEGEEVPFICPATPPLPADEQLTVLEQKKDTCFLRMTPEQLQHYSWTYQGKFPARRQHERKDNDPLEEFELIKVQRVPGGGEASEVSFGRYCTLAELHTAPHLGRFCRMPTLHNTWLSMEEMAQSLTSAVAGALGVGSSALTGAVNAYRHLLEANSSMKGAAKEAALALGEKAWDSLTGAGRLLQSAAAVTKSEATDTLRSSESRRTEVLESENFAQAESGILLHSLSYQRTINASKTTTNSKERFQRYTLAFACQGFDPAIRFATQRHWGGAALRTLVEAHSRRSSLLAVPAAAGLQINVRAEAMLFERENDHTANATYFEYRAAMQLPRHQENISPPECSGNRISGCSPYDVCEPYLMSCRPKTSWKPTDLWPVKDLKLAAVMGGRPLTAGHKDLGELYGLEMRVHCGSKHYFGTSGAPDTPHEESLLDCLRRGVEHNSRLRARQPWKVFFPDEVVVVAEFSEVVGRRCKSVKERTEPTAMLSVAARQVHLRRKKSVPEPEKKPNNLDVCSLGATQDEDLDNHIPENHKRNPTGGVYRGLHSGAGFPKGTPSEVTLRPEDVLEALGLLHQGEEPRRGFFGREEGEEPVMAPEQPELIPVRDDGLEGDERETVETTAGRVDEMTTSALADFDFPREGGRG